MRSFIHTYTRICRGSGRWHCQVLLPNTMVTLIDVDWPSANAFARLVCGQSVSATDCQLPMGHRPHTESPSSSLLYPLSTILSVALSIMLQAICCNLPIKCFMFKRQKQQQNTHPQRVLSSTLCISLSSSLSLFLSLSVCLSACRRL